jgi:hypothetical protein
MLFLGFIPLISYAKVSADVLGQSRSQSAPSLFTGDPDAIGSWQGKVILIVTLVVAVFAAVSLVLYLTINPYVSDLILTISGAIAGGWALTVLLWLLGFIWKVFTIHTKMKQMVKSNPFAGQVEFSVSPGIGLWIGMVVALASVAVFSILLGLRGKTLWIYLAEGVGLLLGVLMMLVAVQPWKTPFDNKGTPPKGFGPFSQRVMPDRGVVTMRRPA